MVRGNFSRRRFLQVVPPLSVAGFAGCVGSNGTDESTASPTDRAGVPSSSATSIVTSLQECEDGGATPVPSADLSATYAISGSDAGFLAHAAVTRSATETHPALVAVTLTNRRSEAVELQFGVLPPLSGLSLSHEGTRNSLLIVPLHLSDRVGVVDRNEDGKFQVVPDDPTNGCWTAEDRPVAQDSFETASLDPCGSVRGRYRVLNDPANDGCPPAGTYSRTDRVSVRETGTEFETSLAITVPDESR